MMEPSRARAVRFLLIGLLVYFALASFPSTPRPRGAIEDENWVLGLNMARAQGLVAGTDIVYSYGPLGWLRFPDPTAGGLAPVFVYRFGLWLVWLASMARLAVTVRSRPKAAWLVFIFGAIVLADVSRPDSLDFAVAGLALLPFVDEKLRRLELAGLAVLVGLTAMVKLNDGVVALLLLISVGALTMRRRLAEPAAICVASLIGFYLLATGRLSTLPAYLRYGWEIMSGYSASVGLAGPLWQAWLAVTSIAVLLIGIPAVSRKPRALMAGLLPAAVVAFFGFKHAMVRHDAHVLAFGTEIGLAALFLLVCAAGRDVRLVGVFQVAALLFSCYMTSAWPGMGGPVTRRLTLVAGKTALWQYAHWNSTYQEIEAADRRNRDSLSLVPEYHATIGSGSVDALPWDIARVRANGWRWRPRPVLQSYAAYTPELDRLDAEHLAGPHGADFVLLDWKAIDGRHPFLETPLSWRVLLDRFEPRAAGGYPLLLARRATGRLGTPRELGTIVAHWEEPLRLPGCDGILMARAEIGESVLGSARVLLYRVDPVYLDVTYASGETRRWRTVWPNLANGFIVDPMPRNQDEFAAFARTLTRLPDPVVSIAFHTGSPGQYRSTIRVVWFELPRLGTAP